MQRAWTVLGQGLAVAFGAIAFVGSQAIGRPAMVKPDHQRIPGLLGHNAGGGDGPIELISTHEAGLGACPRPQGQHAINPHGRDGLRQPLQGPQHRQLSRGTNAVGIDLPG
jgi:hypothetical protein